MALAERGAAVAVLEAEERLAAHQSGRNSGVVHSGLYYAPGSLKARLSIEGAAALEAFCAEEEIALVRCGKLVVATREDELPRLDELERRGRANGLTGLARLSTLAEIRAVEPHAAGLDALYVPQAGVVDYGAVTRAYARRVEATGGEVRTGARVHAVRLDGQRLRVETAAGAIECAALVNCAGLQSDRVARLCGVAHDVAIVPFRGEYFALAPDRRHLVRALLYPVPDPRFPFLGVHLTRMFDGRVEAGPNAVLALRREGYRRSSLSARDAAAVAANPGFWRFLARHWRMAAAELKRSTIPGALLAEVRRLVPEVGPGDLRRSRAGVRAQAMDRQGNLLDDFRIVHAERQVHVLNAPSPGATASIAIGRTIAAAAMEALG